jgi:membrane protein YqaA with SNARE-associated domain
VLAAKVLALFGVVAGAVWINLYGAEAAGVEETVRAWGYPGLFAMSALSGFNLLVPIPIVLFFPFFLEIGMNAGAAVVTISAGMTTGDLVGFLLGSIGREVVELPEGRVVRFLRDLRRRPWVPYVALFFYASFVPLPNEILVIPMAFLGFSIIGIFGSTFVGNLIFNSLAALGLTGVFGGG